MSYCFLFYFTCYQGLKNTCPWHKGGMSPSATSSLGQQCGWWTEIQTCMWMEWCVWAMWRKKKGKNSPSTCKSQRILNWSLPAKQFHIPLISCAGISLSCVGEAEWVTAVQNKEVQDSCPNSCASYLNFSLVHCKKPQAQCSPRKSCIRFVLTWWSIEKIKGPDFSWPWNTESRWSNPSYISVCI